MKPSFLQNSRCVGSTFTRSAKPVCVLILLVLFPACSSALAQLRLGNLKADKPTVFAIAPREATRPLKLAEKAIQDGDFQQATRLLGDLLAETMLNEYLVPDDNKWGRAISLRQRAEGLLGQIPYDQRRSYEEKYGLRARVILKNAIAAQDTQAIAQISRLYFHTRAGLEATMLMGHAHLSNGRPMMAAVAFEKVADASQGRERFDPEVTLLAAVSWSLNGSTERGAKLLRALKKRVGNAEVQFYGKRVPLFDDNTPVQRWLKEIVTSTPLQSHPVVNQWLVYRGDTQRNAESGGGFPLLSPRWSLRTVTNPDDEVGIQQFQQQLIQSKLSPMPKVHPLAIGKTLVIRTDDRMYGVDADSGKRIWSYPPADVFRSQQQLSVDAMVRPSPKLRQDKLRERLWLDALYGQISSDGDSIYLIPNPGISTDRDDWRSYQTQVYDEPTDLRLYNELKSLDLKQQGALQWQVGGESGLDEPKLARSFFLGAPLPIENRLYAICVLEKSVSLVVLDAETGRLQWSRHLASTEEAVSFREDRLRRLAGATPSESNGILVCPTGLNAIVAVDLATQSLSWGFQFEVPNRTRVDRLTDQLNKWPTMWRDATVTLTEGAVVYTPIDSDEVFCLNLQTGKSLWSDRRRKQSRAKYKAMHVETVRSGEIILTSSDRLRAIELDTGKVSWTLPLGDYGLVSGRGYVSGDHCYVPTTTKKVLRVNAATGEVDGVAMTEKVLGNLISFRGDVISHGADHLTAYPRDEPSRLLLAEQNGQQPGDHALLSIKAQLHLMDGQYAQSVDAISQAYDLFPNSNYAKVLVQALKRLIETDFAKAERISDRYQDLFDRADLQRLLRGKVTGLMKLDRLQEAFATLLQISETIDLKPPTKDDIDRLAGQRIKDETSVVLLAATVDEAESLAKDSANAELTMQLNQWLRWKTAEVFELSNVREKEALRSAIAEHLERFEGDSLIAFHQRMRLFPTESLSAPLRTKTAALLFGQQQYVRAISLLTGENKTKDSSEPPVNAIGHAQRLLTELRSSAADDDQIAELESAIDELTAVRTTGRNVLASDYYEAITDPSRAGQLLPQESINVLWKRDVDHVSQQTSSNYFIGTQHFCEIIATDQPELNTLSFRYSDEFREFQMFDRLGRFVHKIYLDPAGNFQGTKRGTKGRIFLRNSVMLLCIDEEMFAIDWEKFSRGQPALMWYADDVKCSSRGIAGNTLDGICVLSDGLLMCLSPFTGEVLWQRNQVSARATLLEGDQTLTLWNRTERKYDVVDRNVGRFLNCGQIDGINKIASLAAGDLQLFVHQQKSKGKRNQKDDHEQDIDDIFNTPQSVVEALDLNLFDFNQQKFLWTKTFAYPAHSTLVDQDHMLVLANDGTFSMIEIRSGKVKFETNVPELANEVVSAIAVQRFNGIYLVTVYSVNQQSEYINQDEVRVTFKRMRSSNALINGNLIALDADTGHAQWMRSVTVQRFQLLEGLPWDCPFLFLARRNNYESSGTQVRIQMALVDMKSGKLKANELFKVSVRDDVFYQVICQPKFDGIDEQVIELDVAALRAQFFLKDILTPPQPVAALTNQGSYMRMKREVAGTPTVLPLATDLQSLVDEAVAAQAERKELGEEELRLTEIEMQAK